MNFDRLVSSVKKSEGLRLKPYKDTVGKLTIGYGRNIEDRGITLDEAEYLLETDIKMAIADAKRLVPSFYRLSDLRQEVLVEMSFNLGVVRLSKFKKMLRAVDDRDFDKAAVEMLDSRWAKQVKGRATRLAEEMRKG